MKKMFVFIPVLLILLFIASSSNSTDYWAKTYGDTGDEYSNCLDQTEDGGYVLAWEMGINQTPGQLLWCL